MELKFIFDSCNLVELYYILIKSEDFLQWLMANGTLIKIMKIEVDLIKTKIQFPN